MSSTLLWVGGYLACSASAFWLLQHDWRRELDVDYEALGVMLVISALGPLGLIVALAISGIYLVGKLVKHVAGPNRAIWRRRGR